MDPSAVPEANGPQTNGEEPAILVEPDRLTEPVGTEEPPRLPFPVVGIGSSAGGLEAFIEFFDAMPGDSGIAFVLVQHLPPDRESLIAEILAKHTEMPVLQVEDGMSVEPNHVYVIRPGHTMTIHDGRLHLGAALEKPGHKRPVDDFFRSLADEQRQRAVCIIMSGMGSNGTAGAEAIKAVGGMAIAQEPESAKFTSMPRHLVDSGNADFVRRPDEMPEILLRYATHHYVTGRQGAESAGKEELEALSEIYTILKTRTKRDFTGYKKPTIFRRIQRRMGLNQIETLPEYAIFLRQTPAEVPFLSDDLMIHVTGFFRDDEAWEALQQHVIKPLVAGRTADADIRCWVTACSSGEEAYTLAMLLWEAVEEAGKSCDVKVFATDMAERSLGKARAGIYPLGIEAEVPPERLSRFFERDDSVYRVKKELREMVVFAPQNVLQDPPFSKLDICTCRNLLIYLEPEVQRRVLALLHFGLREAGALFLGASETITGVEELFEPIDKRARIFRRVGPTRPASVDFAYPLIAAAAEALPTHVNVRATVAQVTQRALLEKHTPAAVTVDREQRIVYFHGDTTPFLVQPPGEPTRDLISMARETIRGAIRSALQQAIIEKRPAVAKAGFIEVDQGRMRFEVHAEPIDSKFSPSRYYLVSFHQVNDLPPPKSGDGGSRYDAAELESELQRVRGELQNTIEELQSTNEEMRASNEETMSINEELQSTNEELETSKEELQSLNEELTTVNIQLQTKMEEHEATTNDLSSLLSSTNIAVIFLDTRFRIRSFTPAVKDLIELIPSDMGRPLSDLNRKFNDDTLLSDAQKVLNRLSPVEQEVVGPNGSVFMRRVTPYRTLDNRIEGVVITFVDVTDVKHAEERRSESEARYRVITESARDFAIILMDAEGRIETWNPGAERILGYAQNEVVGQSCAIIYPEPDAAGVFRREAAQAAHDGRAADETWHVRKGGDRFWANGVLSSIRNSRGEVTGFVKILRDETMRKQAGDKREDLLSQAQSARIDAESGSVVKDQFLARLSHEMRTPLSSILTWSEMLQRREVSDELLHEGLRVIERSATAQKELLDDLLDTSRIASGKMRLSKTIIQPKRLAQAAVEALSLSAGERGVALELHPTEGVGPILADPDRLRQVLSNLIVNAIKFTPSGGRVDVHLEQTDHHLELRVSDTGQGIEPQFLQHVFTPFSQADPTTSRSYGGLGLGLAICRELVEMHGGTIRAESAGAGQGATFIVHLPLPTPAQLEETAIELEPIPHQHGAALRAVRILLVEDDHATQAAFARMLAGSGAEVTTASTADEAFAAFAEAPPNVLLSDIGLPGEDGYALLKRIRQLEQERGLPTTPAIALTAFAGPQHRRRAKEAGFQAHIAKPAKLATLNSTIARYAKM